MELKKNPKLIHERKSSIFFFVGLNLALVLTLTAFEWRTYDQYIIDLSQPQTEIYEEMLVHRTTQPPPEPPKPKIINPVVEEASEEDPIEDIVIEFTDELEPIEEEIIFTAPIEEEEVEEEE